MKIHATFFIVLLLILFSACEQKTKAIPNKSEKEVVTDTIVSKEVHSHESEKNIDLSSRLEEKVIRLSQLKHKYQLKILEVIPAEKTIILGGLQRVLKLKDTIKSIDVSLFQNGLHEIRTSFLKGSKPMSPNGNTYPRVTVEEYIFKTPEAAKLTYEMLINSKGKSSVWTYVSKAPHEFFLEENRLYFVGSGGFYMMEIYKDIVAKIRD